MPDFLYRGALTKEISFPLGGIGTGCIGLGGNGRLIDWEIFNRPSKGSTNTFSHFAVKAERNGQVLDARVLNGDLTPPYTGAIGAPQFQSYGFGPHRGTMAGVPHFKDAELRGEFPLAEISFKDNTFPGAVSLSAFNPFIPLNDRDSSIPAAFFEITVNNSDSEPIVYTIASSLGNPISGATASNRYERRDDSHLILLTSGTADQDDPQYGNLCVATDGGDVGFQEYWYRGRWFDNLEIFWREFSSTGPLKNRTYTTEESANAISDLCTLTKTLHLAPGETGSVRFVISWSYPNYLNYWNPRKSSDGECCEGECCSTAENSWKNYYATVFDDSAASAVYALDNWDRLYADTSQFKEALFASSLPATALESVSANLSVLKSPTCLRLTDGSFYGFEGCHCDSGCCEGSCTHVWNYAYALPFLFPKLERSMRDLDFRYNQRPDGGMAFRLQLPIGRNRSSFRPCADGQFGGVIKTYRDWKICGDTGWLRKNWPAVKRSIEFAWADTNEDKWDHDRDGVLEGRQHHTLDMELFGPNSWLTGFYLAALKAGAEMAEHLGEPETAAEYRSLFLKGSHWVDAHLFNGEYYHQRIDVKDRSVLERFEGTAGSDARGDDIMTAYWNDEAGEIKYQIAEGSEIDQINAQWHANICGLGDIFDPAQRRKALESLVKYNFKTTMRNVFNPCRLYCLNDEGGLLICEWPEDKYRPVVPLPYAEETQNGYEYQAAILMIQEGLIEEGMRAVAAIRSRYDGEKRNPWNEFECGNNYARSMASYSLIPAFSGFQFDMVNGMIGFDPIVVSGEPYTTFWSLDSGWGLFRMTVTRIELSVLYGYLEIRELRTPKGFSADSDHIEIAEGNGSHPFPSSAEIKGSTLLLDRSLHLGKGDTLRIRGVHTSPGI